MKPLLLIMLIGSILLRGAAIEAATVCVIIPPSGKDAGVIATQVPCGESDNPPATSIDTADPRWVTYLSNHGVTPRAIVKDRAAGSAAILRAGLTMTFAACGAPCNGTYAADRDSLNNMQLQVIGAKSSVSIEDTSGVSHTMGQAQYQALLKALINYANLVNDAAVAAVANGAVPLWPSPTDSSPL